MNNDLNVLGEPLQPCSMNPLTGFIEMVVVKPVKMTEGNTLSAPR